MTISPRDEDTTLRYGEHDSVERRERIAVREQITRLKQHLAIRIRKDATNKLTSPYTLVPARVIAQRLSASSRDEFWTALEQSLRDGAFDASPPAKSRRLYVFNDCPLLRLTSDVLADISAIEDADLASAAYLKNAWASIQTWHDWCPGDRFVLPPSWGRVIAERDRQRSKSIAPTETQPHGLALRQVDADEAREILSKEIAGIDMNNGHAMLAKHGVQYLPAKIPGSPPLKQIIRELKPRGPGRPPKPTSRKPE